MSRWKFSLILQATAFLLVIALGIVANIATSDPGGLPRLLKPLNSVLLPLLGVMVLLALVAQIMAQSLADAQAKPRPAWSAKQSPFPGLKPFTEEYANVFFGRQREIEEIHGRLNLLPPPNSAGRFLPVVGPSGAGKSSLVRAGLIPQLNRRSQWIIIPPMIPSENPFHSLADNLAQLLPEQRSEDILHDLRRGPDGLSAKIQELLDRAGRNFRSILLIIDQFEDLFTLVAEGERINFLRCLAEAQSTSAGLWIVVTLRSEYLTACLETEFAALFRLPVTVGTMERGKLFDVIRRPAEQAQLTFDPPELVDTMVSDASGGDGLPMLAYVLNEMYRISAGSGRLTGTAYHSLGGVAGAISRQADRIVARLDAHGDGPRILPTLLRLVTVTGDEPSQRPVRRTAFDEGEERVVDAFLAARLLTSKGIDNDAIIYVSHEALFRRWPPLRNAIDAYVEELRLRSDLERWALEWEQSGHSNSYLLQHERLTAAAQWVNAHPEIAEERPVVATFVDQSRRADRVAMLRIGDAIAERSLLTVRTDPELSLALALVAVEECGRTSRTVRALAQSLEQSRLLGTLTGHTNAVHVVAWSPDGRLLATGAADRTARVWNSRDASEKISLRGHEGRVGGIAWSPDGTLIATASADRTVRIWDSRSGSQLRVLRGHRRRVCSVDWSPDGERVATASSDQTVRIWSPHDGMELIAARGHAAWIYSVQWSPDGRYLATASHDRTARIWDASTGEQRLVLHGHEDWVYDINWSPTGSHVATASQDRTIRVWDAASGVQSLILSGGEGVFWGVAWSPNGNCLASASADQTARIWDAHDGSPIDVLRGHRGWVRGISWAPDGGRVATVSFDGTGRVWKIDRGTALRVLRGHRDWVRAVAWSPNGRLIASGSQDRTVRVWDWRTGMVLRVLEDHDGAAWSLSWSPDGERLAVAAGGAVHVWRVQSGEQLRVIRGHDDWIRVLMWAPSGNTVATGSFDRNIRIWNVSNGTTTRILRGHDDFVLSVAWNPDGTQLATSSQDRTTRVWDIHNGTTRYILRGHRGPIWSAVWSPDGTLLCTASTDGTARLWDAVTGAPQRILSGHDGAVWSAAWSPDGTLIASASQDGTLRTWDAHTGAEIAVIGTHHLRIDSVSWSKNGRYVATGSHDRTVRVWDAATTVDSILGLARSRPVPRLGESERRNLGLPVTPASGG